ncbi:DUF2306 domain-containing protein [Roseicyclus sp.]
MSFDPILTAPFTIQLHLAFAAPSVVIGTFVLFWLRPGRWHTRLGYAWVTSMAGLALTGFLMPGEIRLIGPVGPLHLFSALTLWSLWTGIGHARAGNIAAHRATFEGLWFGGIGGAGLLNFIPGRTVNRALLGAHWEQGWWVIALGALVLAALWARRNLPALRNVGRT